MEKPEDNSRPLVEMVDVTISPVHQPDMPEISDINWQIMPGDYWIIGGLHGSGKSDLLATAAGLQRPTRGKVLWSGRDISSLKESELIAERMKVGIVFENGGRMFRHLTVAENIALPLRYHRDWTATQAEEELKELLALTELAPFAHNTTGMLDLSWQQRVGLARTLALKPEVLLVDKPLSGRGHLRWWLDFLGALSTGSPLTKGNPVTLAVTTDEMTPWLEQGRQFAVLKKNRWHAVGERAELAAKPETLRDLWAEDLAEK